MLIIVRGGVLDQVFMDAVVSKCRKQDVVHSFTWSIPSKLKQIPTVCFGHLASYPVRDGICVVAHRLSQMVKT